MSDVFEGYEKYVRPTMMQPAKPEPSTFEMVDDENNATTPNAEPREADTSKITEEMKAALFKEFKAMMQAEAASDGQKGESE